MFCPKSMGWGQVMRWIFIVCIAFICSLFVADAKERGIQLPPTFELPPSDPRWALKDYGYWKSWRETQYEELGTFCYGEAGAWAWPPRPFLRSSRPMFFVRTIPKHKIRNDVFMFLGFKHHPKYSPVLTVGKEEFLLTTDQENAYLRDPSETNKLLTAMTKNEKMLIRGITEDGTRTEDDYNIRGVSEMLEAIHSGCPM